MSSPGTADEDTVCHSCPNGTYSNTVSALKNCTQHKSCDAPGLKLVLKGSAWHDSVCTSCQELVLRGKVCQLLKFIQGKGTRRVMLMSNTPVVFCFLMFVLFTKTNTP